MDQFVWGLIRAVRPRQWIKNFAVFTPLLFAGPLLDDTLIKNSFEAFVLFCGFSSATYLLNDIFDIERDRLHPFKRKRPIAAGIVHPYAALGIAVTLIIVLLPWAYKLSPSFFLAAVTYLILQIVYSSYLKHVILLDVMVIAAGFVLRVYAGIWATNAHLNVWFLLSIISFALFIAIGKRRSELTLLQAQAAKHRETLLHYPEDLLDILTSMFANSTWLTYAIFAFEQPSIQARHNITTFFVDINLPFNEAKYLMATIPVVIYGVMRYLYIIYEKKQGESPERVLITDTPLLATVTLWGLMVIGIIYFLKEV